MDRGISNVLAFFLIIVLMLILSISMFVFNINLQKSPFVCVRESEILPRAGNAWWKEQVVELTHTGGDRIGVKNLKITVEVYRDGAVIKRCVLDNFPWKCNSTFIRERISGDVIIQTSPNNCTKFLGELHYKRDGSWDAGDKIGFRIKYENSGEGINLKSKDIVRITLIYKPINDVIYSKNIVVS